MVPGPLARGAVRSSMPVGLSREGQHLRLLVPSPSGSVAPARSSRGWPCVPGHIPAVALDLTCGHEVASITAGAARPARHARRHALGKHQPVIATMPIGRDFTWCHEEDAFVG